MKKDHRLSDADIVEHRQRSLRKALDDSTLLIEFLTSSSKSGYEDEIAKVVGTQHAYAANPQLSEEAETAFWLSYSKLATAVRPATVEGIRYVAPNRNIGFLGWMWRNRWITLTVSLIAFVYLIVQIHVVIGTTLVNRYTSTAAELVKANQAKDQDKVDALANDLSRLTSELAVWNSFEIATLYLTRSGTGDSADQLTHAQISLETSSSYLLPLILGLLGAATQVLRSIARRIAEQSLNTTLLPAYYIRVLLGYIIGTIIGLFMLPSVAGNASNPFSFLTSLPLLTAAFVAGYGVEILFTVLDKFVNDLKSYIGGKDDAGNAPKPK